MARLERIAQIETPDSAPRYELRVRRHGPADAEFEIWQMPAVATPRVTSALRVAGLRGRNLELLFRTLAPMRSRDNMRAVAEGIEAMGREEAAYWLGMAMHRKHPRRVLTALRFLLTDPRR